MNERYFDHAATTPIDARVLREMEPFLREAFGNAHSSHAFGRRALAAVDLARERLAQAICADDPSQIVFTSGATESNNWVLRGRTGVVSPFEHASIREPAKVLGLEILANTDYELASPSKAVEFSSVMAVNNEVGAVFEPRSTSARRRHSDMTQALGKIPCSVEGLDFASFSSHKVYGPKGVGALFVADADLAPATLGGDHEFGQRAGTLNVPGIVGFGLAAQIAVESREADARLAADCRAATIEALAGTSDWRVNESSTQSPFILSVSFEGLEGETLAIEVDGRGFAISSGAACSSRKTEPSPTLLALGLDPAWAKGTVRISYGRDNNVEASRQLGSALAEAVNRVRSNSSRVNSSARNDLS